MVELGGLKMGSDGVFICLLVGCCDDSPGSSLIAA